MTRIVPILLLEDGTRYSLTRGKYTIGSQGADIIIVDSSLQPIHARLMPAQDQVVIQPESGEVYVDEQPVPHMVIVAANSVIRLGNVNLQLVFDSPMPQAAVPTDFRLSSFSPISVPPLPPTSTGGSTIPSAEIRQKQFWRRDQLNRLDLEWELLQKHWPGWSFYESDRSVVFMRPMRTNFRNVYHVRMLVKLDYPDEQPELYVVDLPEEVPQGHHRYHTLELNANGQRICGYQRELWQPDDSLIQAALRLREWLEAFDDSRTNPQPNRDIASILD